MKGNLILLATAIVLSLYAAELTLYYGDLRFVAGLPASIVEVRCPGPARADPRCMQAARDGVPFDPRTALEVFRDFAEQGDTVWPAVHATLFEPGDGLAISDSTQGTRTTVPLAGISDTETLLCNESGTWVFYQADEHGLNNPQGVHGQDSVALAVVGDSFVHGWCVPPGASIAGLLRRRHGPVLNLGLEGSGPLAQLGLLREYGRPLRPALVLWLFFAENDLGDLAREMETPILAGYLEPGYAQGLRSVQPEIDAGLKVAVRQRREVEENQMRRRAERLRGDRLGRDQIR